LNFLIAQIYSTYKRSGALNPEFMVRNYLFLLTFLLLMSVFIIIVDLVDFFMLSGTLGNYFVLFIGLTWVLTFFIGKFYKRYFSNRRLVEMQSKCVMFLPTYLVYSIMVFLLMFCLLLGPSLAVLLTGGIMLGERCDGILRH
jgi:hypothetical protein